MFGVGFSQEANNKIDLLTRTVNDFGDKIVDPSTWDHLTNIVFFKLFGCISAAAGFATLHQWLNSLNNNKKPGSDKLLPVAEPEIVAAKKMGFLTSESIEPEELEPEELTQETADKKEEKIGLPNLKNRAGKILPPLVGSLFAITGLVFILKARSISAFFVNRWPKEKLTKI